MSRYIDRQGMDPETRMRLVESDLDKHDSEFDTVHDTIRTGLAKAEAESDGLRKLLTGLLIAVVTTSITIVATVLIAGGAR